MFEYTDDPSAVTAHRPWPLPHGPWIMAQRWNDLLFAHWPVQTSVVRSLVPQALALDLHAETAWVSVTPFHLSHLRARGLPSFPVVSEFPELNVRTYVTMEGKPGVYFFSLDAGSPLAVAAARALYHLPYHNATMHIQPASDGGFEYRSRRDDDSLPAELHAHYRPTGDVREATPGSLDHWLTERYCLYALDSAGHVHRTEIHHVPWPLQPAEAELRVNTMASAAGIILPDQRPRLSFSKRLDVIVWAPQRMGS